MKLYVSVGDRATGKWRQVACAEGVRNSDGGPASLNWLVEITLDTGERVEVTALYAEDNRGVSYSVMCDGAHVLLVLATKVHASGYDPTALFASKQGQHVQLMLGA